METIQLVILGCLLGGVYAVMATGLTLMFGVMRIINLAHGAFMILAAYLAFFLFRSFRVDPFLSIAVTAPSMFLLGLALYRTLFSRIADAPRYVEMTVLLTFGLALIAEGVMAYSFTGIYRSANPSYATGSLSLGPFFLPRGQLYASLASVLLLVLLWAYLHLTRTGYAIRATMQNRMAAQIVGVNVARVSTIAFGIGMAFAGAAGSLMSYLFTFFPNRHWEWVAILLSLIVVGGLGSLAGAFIGAVALSVAATLVGGTFGATWSSITFYLALFLILLTRAEGLLGKKAEA
jgi:branched-chain amino acid transport system permease protein